MLTVVAPAATAVSNNGRWEVAADVNQPGSLFRLKNHLQYFGFWAGSVAAGASVFEQRGTVNFTMGAGPGACLSNAVPTAADPGEHYSDRPQVSCGERRDALANSAALARVRKAAARNGAPGK